MDALSRFGQSHALLRNVVDHAPSGLALVDGDGRIVYANATYARMLGYAPNECLGLEPRNLVHPEDEPAAREDLRKMSTGVVESYRAERRFKRKNHSYFWALVSASVLREEGTGFPVVYILQLEDIDQARRAEAQLLESESRWNAALEGAGQGVWDHDLRTGRVFYSQTWRRMRGFDTDEAVDASRDAWLARVHPEDRERILNQIQRQDSGELPHNAFEYRERHRDGEYIWILSRGRPIEWMPDGSVARIVGTDTNITRLKEEEARAAAETAETYRRHLAALEKAHEATEAAHRMAETLARHDALTGLPNRRVFNEELEAAVAKASTVQIAYALMVIDLDRFKPINDIHGHPVGDDVLRAVAGRLKQMKRQGDTLARLGGDEFAVIVELAVPPQEAAATAADIARRIVAVVEEPIEVENRTVQVGASVGIALCPYDDATSEKLLQSADLAMYRAKEAGRGSYCFFERSMEELLRERVGLEEDVRRAIVTEAIVPHYQPLIKLPGEQLVGFEILARWTHPTRGSIEPDSFIPVIERLGLMAPFTYSLLRRACRDARDWPSHITISLNVSPKHFSDPLLPIKLLAILSEAGLSPSRLEIEVTESALVSDLSAARTVLTALHDVGIKVSLDDFGTGYGSLYALRDLRFDKIKIDRSFVQQMETDAESAKIVRSVIELARQLGLPTIAEGIEDTAALDRVVADGAEYGQGYYFGRAMSASAASALLRGDTNVSGQKSA